MRAQGYGVSIPRTMTFQLDTIHDGLDGRVNMKQLIQRLVLQGLAAWAKDRRLPEIPRGSGRTNRSISLSPTLARDLEFYNKDRFYTMSSFIVGLMKRALDEGWTWSDDWNTAHETEATDPVLRGKWHDSWDQAAAEAKIKPKKVESVIVDPAKVPTLTFAEAPLPSRVKSLATVEPRAMTDEEKIERMRRDEQIAEEVTDDQS